MGPGVCGAAAGPESFEGKPAPPPVPLLLICFGNELLNPFLWLEIFSSSTLANLIASSIVEGFLAITSYLTASRNPPIKHPNAQLCSLLV